LIARKNPLRKRKKLNALARKTASRELEEHLERDGLAEPTLGKRDIQDLKSMRKFREKTAKRDLKERAKALRKNLKRKLR